MEATLRTRRLRRLLGECISEAFCLIAASHFMSTIPENNNNLEEMDFGLWGW